jgi:hypothetical protein
MTDARNSIPSDRLPETMDDGTRRAAVARSPLPRERVAVERGPLNPWMIGLVVAWIALLVIAFLFAIGASSTANAQWDGDGDDPHIAAGIFANIALFCFVAGLGVLVSWVVVHAIQWKAPADH